jgi:hypothetical protein
MPITVDRRRARPRRPARRTGRIGVHGAVGTPVARRTENIRPRQHGRRRTRRGAEIRKVEQIKGRNNRVLRVVVTFENEITGEVKRISLTPKQYSNLRDRYKNAHPKWGMGMIGVLLSPDVLGPIVDLLNWFS